MQFIITALGFSGPAWCFGGEYLQVPTDEHIYLLCPFECVFFFYGVFFLNTGLTVKENKTCGLIFKVANGGEALLFAEKVQEMCSRLQYCDM